MPHVSFSKKSFLTAIDEPSYSDDQIEALFARLGMEAIVKELAEGDKEIQLEFMANRYDLSGMEGVVHEVRCFLKKSEPLLITSKPATLKFYVDKSAEPIRPFAIGAVLRGITFTSELYQHFIDLQEKLHDNACRKRTLVAIGTHDLSTIEPPFTYRGESPSFRFTPLKTTLVGPAPNDKMPDDLNKTASEWFEYYETKNLPLGKYIHLVKGSPVVPVIRDKNGVLLSLPPIVNGEHSKITLQTKDIFIDVTGTDLQRMTAVMNVIITSFAEYCTGGVESVEVISSHPSYADVLSPLNTPALEPKTYLFPRMAPLHMDLPVSFVNGLLGLSLTANEMIGFLRQKQVLASLPEGATGNETKDISLKAVIPCHRADVLHPNDLAEDVLISYGVDKIVPVSAGAGRGGRSSIGQPLLAEEAVEGVRMLAAMGGYVEMYNFVLLSLDDATTKMRRSSCACRGACCGECEKAKEPCDGTEPYVYKYPAPVASSASASASSSSTPSSSSTGCASLCRCGMITTLNGKTIDTGAARTSLLPCLLLSLCHNNHHPKPISLFEVGDVVLPDILGCGGTRCGKKRTAHALKGEKKCEGICGHGCCANRKGYDLVPSSSSSSSSDSQTEDIIPPWAAAMHFEEPSLSGTVPSDSGARNERRFCAVRCGNDVEVEEMIPLLAHIFSHCRCVFADDRVDPVEMINGMKERKRSLIEEDKKEKERKEKEKREETDEEKEKERQRKKEISQPIPAVWQMIPVSRLLPQLAKDPSVSLCRWLGDTASFVEGNMAILCLTDMGELNEPRDVPLVQIPVGIMGVVRPDVLKDFTVHTLVTAVELNLEPLLERLL
ncbi:putative phenylalanyl-tRNA synthetase beta chain [Monocercomonoides exilis]|uniref:putative phenylalanyl-tRNA synthetase beta chain n=1 Tax=Monocercomonoides exilis TaxID=2049356 RepID=UPI00355A6851|nr:putative phenylalanyl-tRNA synthetase beta chain [Monocercomonoides exilis]|eukprot:MONOS_9913.1-p1 / transcript=MONOS_9913.1 / gene=MONOS_9913 / organism=Monocercomonoides_exilis_PA203 / gene_product=phenylalanyl-tRNA synthetase beta chain / transcript_product=phenylalanyl-tRNA synthetase beta chain / location=Mono_scaffold00426:45374-48077(-) / protein_length=836 / sequence_SO=supercontig / SO=protein_coding / is_pseudo=false